MNGTGQLDPRPVGAGSEPEPEVGPIGPKTARATSGNGLPDRAEPVTRVCLGMGQNATKIDRPSRPHFRGRPRIRIFHPVTRTLVTCQCAGAKRRMPSVEATIDVIAELAGAKIPIAGARGESR